MTTGPHDIILGAVWSPCSKLIAVSRSAPKIVEILDAVTLERLDTFKSPDGNLWLSFSPDSHLLTVFSGQWELTSWDLQTGGPAGTICSELHMPPTRYSSSTYSVDGKVVAAASRSLVDTTTVISTYDLVSRTHTYSYHVPEGHRFVAPIWTCGECLQFITVKAGSITKWKVGFTSIHTLAEVESLPAPDNINCLEESLFLPALSRLAFTLQAAVLVWDAQGSKFLLNFVDTTKPTGITFSPDGYFFACGTAGGDTYLWKDSPTGYILHQNVISSAHRVIRPLLSPSGKSIIVLSDLTIQLQRTIDLISSHSSVPTQPAKQTNFILELSPDKSLAAVVRLWENVVRVLNLKSGNQQLIIDTGMKVVGLRVIRSAIIVVGQDKVVTWNILPGNHIHNTRVNISDSIQTTMFNHSEPPSTPYASISPNFNYIVATGITEGRSKGLNLYDASTGECLAGTTGRVFTPWFTPDGQEVWCNSGGGNLEGWSIIKNSGSGLTRLMPLGLTAHPPGGVPWQSSHNYKVTNTGWLINTSGKKLLWLPHNWRVHEVERIWHGQFLGLLCYKLPEAAVLELLE